MSWTDILHESSRKHCLAILKQAARDRAPFNFEARIRTSQGDTRWINVVGDAPRAHHLRGFITDCTLSRAGSASAVSFEGPTLDSVQDETAYRDRELFEGIPLPVIFYDWYSRRILDVNQVAIEHYGYAKEEFLGLLISDLWTADSTENADLATLCMEATKKYHVEGRHVRKDGSVIDVELNSHVVQIDKKPVRVLVVRDISDQKRFSRTLEVSNERLRSLNRVTGAVIGSLPLKEQAQMMADQVRDAFKVDACVIRLVDGEELSLLASVGIAPDLLYDRIPATAGLSARVMGEGSAISVENARELFESWSQVPAHYSGYEFTSYAGAPLTVKDRIIGIIGIYMNAEQRCFREDDLAHLQIVANNVAVAVLNNELFEQLKEHKATSEAVATMSLALRDCESTDEMLPIIAHQIEQTLNLQSVGVALVDPDSDIVAVRHVSGIFENLAGLRFARQDGLGKMFGAADPDLAGNLRDDLSALLNEVLNSPTAVLGVPLVARGEVIGVLWLGRPIDSGSDPEAFLPSEARLLGIVAEIAAAALRRAALQERTEFHLKRLHSLSVVNAAVSENLDLRTTLDMLLQQLRTQTGIHAAAIHLFDERSGLFKLETSIAFEVGVVVPPLGRDLILNRYRSKLVDLQESGTRGRRFATMIAAGFETYLAVPLISNENILGVLEIYHKAELPQNVDLDNFAEILAAQAAVAVDNTNLLKSLRTANRELTAAYDATIEGWARALDLRDHETEGHTRRVTEMTVDLAKLMDVPQHEISHMRRGALLHDIGKMAIPDRVLLKAGELDQNEWVIMRRHPGIALDLLEPISFLKPSIDIPFCHHEKWDGTGYPRGLKGNQIPLSARIFAVIDVWDALRSDRPYRKGWSREQAVHFIRVQAGRHFDPDVVEVFLNNLPAIDRWIR